MWVGNLTPRPLYPRERAPVPTKYEAAWHPGPVWMVLEKNVKARRWNKVGCGLHDFGTVQSDPYVVGGSRFFQNVGYDCTVPQLRRTQSESHCRDHVLASQISSILWSLKVQYHVHESHPLDSALSQMDQSVPSSSISLMSILVLCSHLRVDLPSGLFPSGFPTKILYKIHFSLHACNMALPSHPPWFYQPSNIWRGVQIRKADPSDRPLPGRLLPGLRVQIPPGAWTGCLLWVSCVVR